MKLMVVGSGGREHALAWKLSQSKDADMVFLVPGNAGAKLDKNIQTVDIPWNDYEELVTFAKREKIDFVVIGPDQALADGLVDKMQGAGVLSFGPSALASRLESSKIFAKNIMQKVNIPTARFSSFYDPSDAKKFLKKCSWKNGWAVKADGLALGKGVVVTSDLKEAMECIDRFMLEQTIGEAGTQIVIEERLLGKELSAFYICDSVHARLLSFACDYKQIYDHGKGPNTGGMGAYCPVDWISGDLDKSISASVVQPLLNEMKVIGSPFSGILFIGLMITEEGPKVLEFNVRFGDPETQAVLPLLDFDFLSLLLSASKKELSGFPTFNYTSRTAVHLVMAAHGYPGTQGVGVRKGDPITLSSDLLSESSEHKLFFAGVSGTDKDNLKTSGGRVLGLTALGKDRKNACELAYEKIKGISFSGSQIRRDIAR